MRAHNGVVFIVLVSMLFGCATTSAPEGFLPRASEAGLSVYGGWVELETVQGQLIEGELLAVGRDSVIVLTLAGTRAVPAMMIHHLKVTGYLVETGSIVAWTLLGTLSTLSHGFWLVLSAPAWLIAGTISAVAYSHVPVEEVWATDLSVGGLYKIQKYARYPQGMPPGLDISRLRLERGGIIADPASPSPQWIGEPTRPESNDGK